MTNLHNNTLRLDHGIEGISHHSQDTDHYNFWPEHQTLPPPSQMVKAQVSELLSSTNTNRYLSSALQPMINDLSLLTPSRFHATLVNSLTTIRQAADEKSENSRLFNKAANLLAEEIGLRELSQMYRSTLYQG